ncbi:hypothetical protein ACS0TY_007862 [Phlomoides rotata]
MVEFQNTSHDFVRRLTIIGLNVRFIGNREVEGFNCGSPQRPKYFLKKRLCDAEVPRFVGVSDSGDL